MTIKGEWVAYTGSDEQISELMNAENGVIVRLSTGKEHFLNDLIYFDPALNFKYYWIIPDDPLREMKIRQARTGQPVYVKTPSKRAKDKFSYYKTTNPNWDEIGAEYSFTPFKE